MTGKAVPSSAGGGPRDFSGQVHAHFTGPASAGQHLEAHVYLGASERDKVSAADLHEAVAELLARHGVDMEQCYHSASGAGDETAKGSGRMPGKPR